MLKRLFISLTRLLTGLMGGAVAPTAAQGATLPEDRAEALEIFAINGQRTSVSFENQQVGGISFSMAGLPGGIYVVKITGEKGVYTAKVIKS